MLGGILSFLGGGTIERTAKIFLGDKEKRDQYQAQEIQAGLEQYAAEFNHRESRTWWDSLVDGINRLMRPTSFFTFLGMFWISIKDPEYFAVIMVSVNQIPELFWYVFLAMVAFLFPSRILEKKSLSSGVQSMKQSNAEALMKNLETIQSAKKKIEESKNDDTNESEKGKNSRKDVPAL